MRALGLPLLVLVIGGLSLGGVPETDANGGRFDLDSNLESRVVTWTDQGDEASYSVSGSIIYEGFSSCSNPGPGVGETVEFSEELAADTTSFVLPAPSDERANAIKDLTFSLKTLDSQGEVLDEDSFAVIVDFCLGETLPSAGARLDNVPSGRPHTAIALLVAFGVAAAFIGAVRLWSVR